MRSVIVLFLLALTSIQIAIACEPLRHDSGRIVRSAWSRSQFRAATPCPSSGETFGSCPGYVVDHVVPLCACGPDYAPNMQWQTTADARAKDKVERKQCRELENS